MQRLLLTTASAVLIVLAACSTPQPQAPSSSNADEVAVAQENAPSDSDAMPGYPDKVPRDHDSDGVPNEADPMPGSLAGAVVSGGGMQVESDGDGIVDSMDAVPAAAAPPPPAYDRMRMHKSMEMQMSASKALRIAPYPAPYCCMQPQDTEKYEKIDSNAIQQVAQNPVSTFSIDVDTGSYSNVRRFLNQGRLPPQDAVRVEEMINYFDYAYAPPRDTGTPFSVHTEVAPAPWSQKAQLLRIGIQGWKPEAGKSRHIPSNLVFLVDVSGSMQDADKLPLVKSSLKLLAGKLDASDRISLVVYAGNTGVVLEPTPGNDTAKIGAALDRLEAGGSTNGAGGIQLAYQMAQQAYMKNGNNRVLLATDGDFNVGITDFEQLVDMAEEKRKSGIALTTLGFGQGNYNDQLMERLADAGNGNYAYIDNLAEAQKVLVDQRDATLRTIAGDVKIQVEFNPALVSEYRLIGYENRALKREDFNNDKIDAGEIGAGHRVTALYEIVMAGSGGERVDPLRYGNQKRGKKTEAASDELAFVRLRYKRPEDGINASSRLIEQPVLRGQVQTQFASASESFRFAAAVAGFGQLLRGGAYTGEFGYTDVEKLVRGARGDDANGYAGELLQLVKLANGLSSRQARVDAVEGDAGR